MAPLDVSRMTAPDRQGHYVAEARHSPDGSYRRAAPRSLASGLAHPETDLLAKKPNYGFEKRKREQEKKAKKEEKRLRKLEDRQAEDAQASEGGALEAPAAPDAE
jgi:hypothetical protein